LLAVVEDSIQEAATPQISARGATLSW
jgi:hypothetical protein